MEKHTTSQQRERLLEHLKSVGSATTTEIRHSLDILAPAARIFELRHYQNINIARTWEVTHNPGGTEHKVARYVYLSGKYREVA